LYTPKVGKNDRHADFDRIAVASHRSPSPIHPLERSPLRDTDVLLSPGYNHNHYAGINELLSRGAAGFIQKPFNARDMGVAIRSALAS
jgi:hypothetical protein